MIEQTRDAVRSVHPAIWRRETGEKVLHVSPWQAAGIEGHEDPEGDAWLEELCQEMYAKMTPYHHSWKPTDMIVLASASCPGVASFLPFCWKNTNESTV